MTSTIKFETKEDLYTFSELASKEDLNSRPKD